MTMVDPTSETPRFNARRLLEVLALAVVYFLTARLGLQLAMPGGHVTPVWPPSGIALAAVLLRGRRVWPGIWLGSFAANFWDFYGSPMSLETELAAAALLGGGASLAALVGSQLLRRFVGGRDPLERVQDVCLFLTLGGMVSCLVSATVGVTTLCLAGYAPWSSCGPEWLTWWLGDTAGVFVVAPLLLVWSGTRWPQSLSRWAELFACFGLLLGVTYYVFIRNTSGLPLAFLPLPVLVWAAVRFGRHGAVTAVGVMAGLSVWGTTHHLGVFNLATRNDALMLLEVFLSVVVLTALSMAASVRERGHAEAAQQRAVAELESRVQARTAALSQANADLRRSENRLRTIIETQPECVKVVSPTGELLDMNPAGLAMLDAASLEELATQPLIHYVAPDHRPAFGALHHTVMSGGDGTLEFETVGLKGTRRWLETRAVPLRDPGGEVTALLGLTRDVTVRKRAEQELRVSEMHHRLMAEIIAGFAFAYRVNPDGSVRLEWATSAIEQVIGYTESELKGKVSFRSLIHPDDRAGQQAAMNRVIAGEPERMEFRLTTKTGEVRWLQCFNRPEWSDTERRVVRILGASQDITRSKLAEVALLEREQRLNFLLGSTATVIYTCRADGDFGATFISENVQSLLGYRPSDFVDDASFWANHIHPEDKERIFAGLAHLFEQGHHEHEYRFRDLKGNYRWMHDDIRLVRDAAGQPTGLVGSWIDVTARREAEAALWENARLLAEAQARAHLGSWELDLATLRGTWSAEMSRLHGRDPALGAPSFTEFLDTVHPEDRAKILAVHKRIPETADQILHEYRSFAPGGAVRHLQASLQVLRDGTGQVVGAAGTCLDITERKKAEQRLAAFAALGRRLNAAPDAVAAARIIVGIADELFGWDACELDLYDAQTDRCQTILTMDILDGRRQEVAHSYVGDPPSPRMRRVIQHGPLLILREKSPVKVEDFKPFGDLNRLSASIIVVPVFEGRTVIGVFSIQSYRVNAYTREDLNVLQDLADHCAGALDRLRGRDALRTSEARFRTIFEQSPLGIAEGEIATARFIAVNQRFADILGYPLAELRGLTFKDYTHPEDLQADLELVSRLAAAEIQQFAIEKRFLRKDGAIIWVRLTVSGLAPPGEKPVNCMAVVDDITDRKKAEESLLQTEALYRRVIAGADAVPYEYDYLTRRYKFMGEGIALLTGYGPEEIGPSLWDQIIQETVMRGEGAGLSKAAASARVLRGELQQWRADARMLTRDGQTRWLADVSVQKTDAAGRVIGSMGILQDITDRKQAEQKLQESSEQLRALLARLQLAQETERIRVAREIHDELGQLLTGLKMDVRWLERKLADPSLPAAFHPLLDRAVAASELADATLAVVQKIAAELRPGALDRLGLAAALTQHARRFQERTGIRCQVTLTEPGLESLAEHATELFYICVEALTNVVRHAHATEVQIRLETTAAGSVLEVCDNGVGIAEDKFGASHSLGLLGMRERAAQCGGDIVWQPCQPQGTRMTVRLPAHGAKLESEEAG